MAVERAMQEAPYSITQIETSYNGAHFRHPLRFQTAVRIIHHIQLAPNPPQGGETTWINRSFIRTGSSSDSDHFLGFGNGTQ